MTSKQEEMPPLPEPHGWITDENGYPLTFLFKLPNIVVASTAPVYVSWQVQSYAAQCVREAVERERERCAQVAEELPAFDMDDPGSTVARHIRLGSTPGEYRAQK
jgi:hypothetical protein